MTGLAPPSPPRPSVPPRVPLLQRPLVRLAIAVALLAVLGGVALAVRAGRDGGASQDATGVGSDAGLGVLGGGTPKLGGPAPDFALRTVDGEVVRLSDYRGKVVWVNFWASWCVPCKRELPDIQATFNDRQADGLVVLTVNYQEDEATAKEFFARHGITLPILMDTRGEVYDAYQLRGLPDSFFIDRDGVLRAQQFGFLTADLMRERLASAGLP